MTLFAQSASHILTHQHSCDLGIHPEHATCVTPGRLKCWQNLNSDGVGQWQQEEWLLSPDLSDELPGPAG